MSAWPSPHTDFKFHPQITQIGCYWDNGNGHTELYLLEGDGLTLIDTGVGTTPEREIAAALRAIGRSLADVDLIINTHGHHDHAGGNPPVVQAAGCPVWIHQQDVAITQDLGLAFDLFTAPGLRLLGRTEALTTGRAAAAVGPTAPIARALVDAELLDLGRGLQLRVINAPGHTLGCVILWWEREGIAIAGDSILGGGSRPGGLPLIFYPDHYARTLALAQRLPIQTLCLGHHYSSVTLTRESIKLGAETCQRFIEEAGTIATMIDGAVARAIADLPQAPFALVAERTLDLLRPALNVGRPAGDQWPMGTLQTVAAVYHHQTGW